MYRTTLESTCKLALDYLENLPNVPVGVNVSIDELRLKLNQNLNDESIQPDEVIKELVNNASEGILGSSGSRFFGWVIGGSLPAALAADWLTSTWDQNAALYASSPAEAIVEEVCGKWLKEILNLPMSASFAITTGCQMAHVTCLAAARNALLATQGWDVEKKGLFGAPELKILCSNQRHGSIERAARYLGLGKESIHNLPVESEGTLSPDTLEKALEASMNTLSIVILQAGDLNIGAFDSFAELIPLAHSYNAWVHIDGAFGLWATTSSSYEHLLKDVNTADSWATDGHKWLNVPFDSGYAFVANKKSHSASMSHRESYLIHSTQARDQIDWTPEWSRRGRGFATYAAIRQLGKSGITNLIERTCRYAQHLVFKIEKLPGTEIIRAPIINQGLVRFLHPDQNAKDTDHDAFTDQVILEIAKRGKAYFGGTTWRGIRCMRISVCNWQTNDEDIEITITSIADSLKYIRENI